MYSTCIFCNAPLGANELLERFPVGRRIAYDQSTGRLWVVCPKCERWNLSPLETRWEAIEDAERLFRATKLKVAGENISLAQTTEGLELVRIGAPPRIELMAWRYGDQFGRRHRRHLIIGSGIAVGAVGLGAASLATSTAPLLLALFTSVGLVANTANVANTIRRRWGPKRILISDDTGIARHMTMDDVVGLSLVPGPTGAWHLRLPHRVQIGQPGKGAVTSKLTELHGPTALRALSRLLPLINKAGGSKRNLGDAVKTIETVSSIDELLRLAAINKEAKRTHFRVPADRGHLTILPARIRLALEMALHEDDERKAMEGELAALEDRWREADALAKIADDLLLPDDVERELARLRQSKD